MRESEAYELIMPPEGALHVFPDLSNLWTINWHVFTKNRP